jgi:hypothetical protein
MAVLLPTLARVVARIRSRAALLAIAGSFPFAALVSDAAAQITTTFTYQGELTDSGTPFQGTADLQFRLFTTAEGPVQVGPTLQSPNVQIENGRFTVLLNFLNEIPAGGYIEVSVRTPHDPTGTLPFTTLAPRQAVTAAPQAYRAEEANYASAANIAANALSFGGQLPSFYQDVSNFNTGTLPSGRLSGTYSQSVGFTNPGNAFSGSGAGLTGLNANNFVSGVLPAARGGTGSSISSATTGDVLKWNGAAFTAQAERAYVAGAGLALAGSTFSIPGNAVSSAMLASDAGSLAKVSGGAITASGPNVAFAGSISIPTTTRTMIIPAAAFVSRGSEFVVTDEGRIGVPFGGFVEIIAPVTLPIGARITGLVVYATDNTLQDITVRLNSAALEFGSPEFPVTLTTAGLSGNRLAVPVTGLNIEILPTRAYSISADWSAPSSSDWSMALRGVRIDYTITSPLP